MRALSSTAGWRERKHDQYRENMLRWPRSLYRERLSGRRRDGVGHVLQGTFAFPLNYSKTNRNDAHPATLAWDVTSPSILIGGRRFYTSARLRSTAHARIDMACAHSLSHLGRYQYEIRFVALTADESAKPTRDAAPSSANNPANNPNCGN